MFVKSVVIVLVNSKTYSEEIKCRIQEFLTTNLKLLNFEVDGFLTIDESEQEVENEIITLSKQYDVVLVVDEMDSKNIFRILGNIFCDKVEKNGGLKLKTNDDLSLLPLAAKLLKNDDIPFPVIYLQRIFLLKRELIEVQFFHVLKPYLEQYASHPFFQKNIQVRMNGNGTRILDNLPELVNIKVQNEESVSNLIVSSQDFENIVECEKILKSELKENFLEASDCMDLPREIYKTKDEHIVNSLKVIEEGLALYGPQNVFLSFNGGKDCTVLLNLVHTVLRINYPEYKKPLLCLYVRSKETFTEQDNFISQCQIFYNLDIVVSSLNIKDALSRLLTDRPSLKAVFMGTRRTDPYSQNLKIFQMTDPNWPQIMRINPILDWHYSDIWDYLLFYKVPYCKLYDLGYTSLGSSLNTIRNPSLSFCDTNEGKQFYLPAYKLIKESEERSGRNIEV